MILTFPLWPKCMVEWQGHILFTPVKLIADDGVVVTGMGLAPLAVHPDFQGQGIGSILM